MPRVNVYVPKRFFEMLEKLAKDDGEASRSALLGKLLVLGLRSYVDIRREAKRVTGDPPTENMGHL